MIVMSHCVQPLRASAFNGWCEAAKAFKMVTKAALSVCAGLFFASSAQAGFVQVPGASLGTMGVKVTSIKERRFKSTVQQQFDFSCGSAALATLLSFHYDDKVTETDVFKAMYDIGDKDKIRKEGFSLLDMKIYLEKRGYRADGFKISLDKLHDVGVPAIVLVNNKGFKHFIVIKGVTRNEVLVGDPALGSRAVTRREFEPSWNGLVFLVRNKKDVASRHFNQPAEWPPRGGMATIMPLTDGQLMNPTLYLPMVSGH